MFRRRISDQRVTRVIVIVNAAKCDLTITVRKQHSQRYVVYGDAAASNRRNEKNRSYRIRRYLLGVIDEVPGNHFSTGGVARRRNAVHIDLADELITKRLSADCVERIPEIEML